MTYTFDTSRGLVIVPVFLAGPRGADTFQFAIDTAATRSAASGLVLEALGFTASQASGQYMARTASGGVRTGAVRVQRFAAFGDVRADFPVLWLPLPPSARIDGLLGLDFFRGSSLLFDFARGRVSCPASRRWWRFW